MDRTPKAVLTHERPPGPSWGRRSALNDDQRRQPRGGRLIILTAEPTSYDGCADEVVREPIDTGLPRLLRQLGAKAIA
ncbi:hypothetical protein [Streptomyces sp. NPDC001978]|uniref:hypothetical protein n=1 Tax=Streptomyces sp. NPDC001978 TaxID=3364627 RepID=UPI0036BF39A6